MLSNFNEPRLEPVCDNRICTQNQRLLVGTVYYTTYINPFIDLCTASAALLNAPLQHLEAPVVPVRSSGQDARIGGLHCHLNLSATIVHCSS